MRRPFAFATMAGLLLAGSFASPASAAESARIAPAQQTVALLARHGVRHRPAVDARRVSSVSATRPITGARTVLPVIGQRIDGDGRSWLRVRLPGRVLGVQAPPRTGWISASSTRRSTTAWHIVVQLGARRVLVFRTGRRVRTYRAIVGAPSTPTPRGASFVEENVRMPAGRPGAPFALATSARSTVLQEFDGGPGQIALHGLDNVGGQLGTAASHGCVRLENDAITWLAARIAPGVPITVV